VAGGAVRASRPVLRRPALLAALGAGSVGALLGGAIGSVALAVAGLAVVSVAVAVLVRRRAPVTRVRCWGRAGR